MNRNAIQPGWVLGICLIALVQPACVYTRVVRDGWAPLRKLGHSQTPPQPSNPNLNPQPAAQDSSDQWAVLVKSFEGSKRAQQARHLVTQLKQQASLSDLWIKNDTKQAHVYRGRYLNPASPEAKNALRQTRMVKLNGEYAFESAQLSPLGGHARGGADAIDLRPHVGMYSLQVGYYDNHYGSGFRKAAEQAAATIRAQGEEAYYYHGPHRSMVTIGLFTDGDFGRDGPRWIYGQRIRALQQKYPYNVANNPSIIPKLDEEHTETLPSFLVRVH